jgi:hypothetical protein
MTGTLRAVRVDPQPLTCALALGLCACAATEPARVPDPRATASAFADAAQRRDADAAWALLDPQLGARLDRAAFERQLADNAPELKALAAHLSRVDPAALSVAEVELRDGERVLLRLEDGQWRIDGGVLDAQALDTPVAAVIELRRALARQSLPALLRVLSAERRAAWLAAFERSMELSADPLDLELDVRGDEAVVHLRGGGEIRLRREGGTWHVHDVR